jgi:hypothetical protein
MAMHKFGPAFAAVVATLSIASAQQAAQPSSTGVGYPTVKAALDAMRAKSGANVSTQAGWTVIEDRAALTVWSFTPAGHPAHPAAVRRTITQEGDKIFVKMSALCEAPKPACDVLVSEFQDLAKKMQDSLQRK